MLGVTPLEWLRKCYRGVAKKDMGSHECCRVNLSFGMIGQISSRGIIYCVKLGGE
jgi:hypothetical protein